MGENVSTSARRSPSSPDQISSSRNSRLVDRQRGGNDGGDDSINAKGDMGLEGGEEGEGGGIEFVMRKKQRVVGYLLHSAEFGALWTLCNVP